MKEKIFTAMGGVGGALATLLGGFDMGLQTLLICMVIDYATGIIVAGVFHKSSKTENGSLESATGFKGLMKKVAILFVVAVGACIDKTVGTTFLRDSIVIGFMLNEVLSIIENVGLMGVPLPKVVTKAIELLKTKAGDDDDKKV